MTKKVAHRNGALMNAPTSCSKCRRIQSIFEILRRRQSECRQDTRYGALGWEPDKHGSKQALLTWFFLKGPIRVSFAFARRSRARSQRNEDIREHENSLD